MRILCVNDLPSAAGGGAEVYLGRLVSALRAGGDNVELFAGEVVHTGARRVLDVWDPAARARLTARVREFKADVVHFHNVVRELSVASLLVPAPRVLTAHDMRLAGVTDPRASRWVAAVDRHIKQPLDTAVARRALDEVAAVSGPVAAELKAAGFSRVTTVPPPAAPPEAPLRPPADSRDIAYVGRLSEDKGLLVLLAAWEFVAARH